MFSTTSHRSGRLGRTLLTAALAATTLTVAVTGALFTDSDAVGSNTFATGNVSLTTNPTTAIVAYTSNMAPGDVDTGSVTVTNDGSLQLRYAVKSTTTEDVLAAQLNMTIWAESAETTVDSVCGATAPATVLYGPADLGLVAGTNVIGDPTQGSQAGDRTLAAAANELLCFRVELPSTTGNTYEGLTTTASFAFESEQTVNNA